MTSRPRLSRDLHVSSLVRIGSFHCGPEQAAWRVENQIGPWPLVAFPGTAVEIQQSGHRTVVAAAPRVVLYNPLQPYRRRLLDPRGDHCHYITFDAAVLHAALAEHGVPAGDTLERPFRFATAPLEPPARLAQTLLVRALERPGPDVDVLAVEEQALALLGAIARALPRRPPAPLARTAARHVELADAIARHLAFHFTASDDLATLAARVGTSPFHAARVFRAMTGTSIHAYRHHLRLHAALLRLAEGPTDLATVALDLGFSSHSHLCEAFRRAFGASPSQLRVALARGRSGAPAPPGTRTSDASKILKAPAGAPR